MNRCIWCNRSDGALRTVTLQEGRGRRDVVVHPEHEAALAAWHARAAADGQRFVTTVAFTPLALLAAVGIAALVSRASTFVVLGLALIALSAFIWTHPYATPLTVRLLGVRRSITLVRVLAAVVAAGGAFVATGALTGARV
jgi:hypothetical protein